MYKVILKITLLLLFNFLALSSQALAKLAYTYYNYNPLEQNSTNTATEKRPVLIWIHGCRQTQQEFVDVTDIVAKTKHLNPIIIAPEKNTSINLTKCWNFLSDKMKKRDGEYMEIVQEVKTLIKTGIADSNRIFVAGFSSGAMFANHLALCFPEVFKGALIHSGAPYNVSASLSSQGAKYTAYQAIQCAGPLKEVQLKTIFYIHGEKDNVVSPNLGRYAFEQAVQYFDYLDDRRFNESLTQLYRNSYGGLSAVYPNQISVHHLEVPNLTHRWSGSKPGANFSSPLTVSAVDIFLNLTEQLK